MGAFSSSLLANDLFPRRDRARNLSGKVVHVEGKSYRLQRKLGAGGFGSVYSARGPEGEVAVKVIDLSNQPPEMKGALAESYLREVANLNRLRKESRHVVRIFGFDFNMQTGQGYIVMELGGQSLAAFMEELRASGKHIREPGAYINPIIRQHLWSQMVSVVKTLTSRDLVHMDLKPDNLVLFGNTLKIVDLGISRKIDVLGQAGVGTLRYSAPEIMRPDDYHDQYYSPKADVWSLGAILYTMAYGEPPHYKPLAADPPYGPQSPDRDLVDVLRRTLVLDPHERIDIYSLARHPYTLRRR